jgi:excisionase family DNA binding protein
MELTIKEYAAVERVHERTVRRWIEKGALAIRRTPGGGIRILQSSNVCILTISERASSDIHGQPST